MLVTLDEMKTYLGIDLTDTTFDAFLTEQILIVSEAIEGYCGRKFAATQYVQTFYRDEMEGVIHSLTLYHFPIISIDKVISGVELTALDYRVQKGKGIIKRLVDAYLAYWFYGGREVEITYTAGYTEIPMVIKHVIYSVVGDKYAKKKNGISLDFGSDVQSVSIPSVISINFDYTLQSNERASKYGMIIGNYANVLDPHRSERPVIGDIRENYVD